MTNIILAFIAGVCVGAFLAGGGAVRRELFFGALTGAALILLFFLLANCDACINFLTSLRK